MKRVIIINGSGGCGKDSIINYVTKTLTDHSIINVSSVDNIKTAAKILG